IDRRRGRRRVQCAKDEMTRFRGFEGDRDRLEISHFTDQNDIGIFAERRTKGSAERAGMRVYLTLVDKAALILMDELDRVLDGDDMVGPRHVDVIDQRRERR